jgi:steroid delta-isomerase-like uncharacterized protein
MTDIRSKLDEMTEAINRHDKQAFVALYHPDAVVVDPMYPEPLRGNEAIENDMNDFLEAFPDLEGRVERVLTDGDTCAVEFSMKGTHEGALLGPRGDLAPSHRPMQMNMSAFTRFDEEGRIVEEHRYYDRAALLDQLGMTG